MTTRTRLRYWEDLVPGKERRAGPLCIGRAQLAAYLRDIGPVADQHMERSTSSRASVVIPDLLLHAIGGGLGMGTEGMLAIVCIRSATYEPRRALHAGEKFFVVKRTVDSEALDERLGLAETEMKFVTASGELVSRAVNRCLVLRRPKPAARQRGAR